MALKKSELRGILRNEDSTNDEKIAEILDLLHGEVDTIKDQRDEIQAELDDLKSKSTQDDGNDWKSKYEAEHQAFEDYKSEQNTKETQNNIRAKYRSLLLSAGISEKRIDSILKVTSLEGMELDENGDLKDSENLSNNAKTEWADFITAKNRKGVETPNPDKNSSGGTFTNKSEIMKLPREERLKAIKENPNLFRNKTE